ncbi:hypothetical protein GQ43DRAFT_444613 [Delitschia confertaspora ATCC 74209]|uniref:Polyketide cyclase/dehydrase n=1 Tax=Delitschia confertaspora ATCC 74209 TaxID=1513339 RepID=A0A9P4MRH8_9PLEO|nr:hypothetical protein GQ43DRAFT_444613 [Delitschia confertaspora ATCC 74209]
MAPSTRTLFALLLSAAVPALAQQTNLPPITDGVFAVSASIELNTTRDALWNALTDFPKYPEWNPFVRSAVMTNKLGIPLPADQQHPIENERLIFRVQIPALPLPVDASTPDNILHTQFSLENVTHVQPELGRLAWKYLSPEFLLDSERWTAVSELENGKVLYESREVYNGVAAGLLQDLYGNGLQESFDAQAQALKLLLEGSL